MQAKDCLRLAYAESIDRGAPTINVQHLASGVLRAAREDPKNVLSRVFADAGVGRELVRQVWDNLDRVDREFVARENHEIEIVEARRRDAGRCAFCRIIGGSTESSIVWRCAMVGCTPPGWA